MSIGRSRCAVVEDYVARQLERHPLADPAVAERFKQYQICNPQFDLSRIRRSNFGEFCHNLHLVFEYEQGRQEFQHENLVRVRDMLDRSSRAKGWQLSRAGIVPDHLHLTVGCGIDESPSQVALSCLNNLAHVYGMQAVFKFSYYVGSIGPYDLGAIWNWQ
jgi:REP element-mobilizing transposase RayT